MRDVILLSLLVEDVVEVVVGVGLLQVEQDNIIRQHSNIGACKGKEEVGRYNNQVFP